MPALSEDRLSRALLQSLKDGTYPDSEEIVSAELPASALSTELQFIRDAREEVKVSL
jgi:protein transport protein DSL1/ZW10